MVEKTYETGKGTIHYWTSAEVQRDWLTLVFLPGLTADHRLFEKQIEAFEDDYNVFVWDAPGHAASWPFTLDFTLMDKAAWLSEILTREGMDKPVIIGQSMGGYVGQMFAEKYPDAMVLMSIFFEAVSSVQVNARTASINNCFLILVIICI